MDILTPILDYFSGTMGLIELTATVVLIVCVWQAAKQNIWTFFWGSIGVILYGYIFYVFKLYSDMLLQLAYFLPIQIVSWYWWKTKGAGDDDLPVTALTDRQWGFVMVSILIPTCGLGYVMETYTDASYPYADALTTMMSVVAQYLLMKKILENWIIWVVMDVIAVNIYFLKGLYVTSGLYVVFLGLATYGFFAWHKSYRLHKEQTL